MFKDLSYPYFKLEWRKHEGVDYQIAEDLYFCDEAVKKGYGKESYRRGIGRYNGGWNNTKYKKKTFY